MANQTANFSMIFKVQIKTKITIKRNLKRFLPEDECVFLLVSGIVVVLDDDQSQFLLLEVELGDLRPARDKKQTGMN